VDPNIFCTGILEAEEKIQIPAMVKKCYFISEFFVVFFNILLHNVAGLTYFVINSSKLKEYVVKFLVSHRLKAAGNVGFQLPGRK
jgi:hypothetical protein